MNTYWDDTLIKIWEGFCRPLKQERTKKQYYRVINEAMELCKKPYYEIDDVDAGKINEIFKATYTINTAYTYITILKRFSTYLIESNLYPEYVENPFLEHFLHYLDKVSKAQYTAVSMKEMDLLLSAAKSDEKAYAIISFIYRTGIRPEMICKIKIRDFYNDSSNTYLRVYKNKQDQIILIPEDLVAILDSYIKAYGIDLEDKDRFLFLNAKKKPLDERTLQRMMNTLSEKAGLGNQHITPYDIRNSSAALFFAYGATKAQVADQLKISMKHVNRYDQKTINPNIVSNTNELVNIHLSLPN